MKNVRRRDAARLAVVLSATLTGLGACNEEPSGATDAADAGADASADAALDVAPPVADAGTVETSTGPYSLSVTVRGLRGTGLVLQNNGGDDLLVAPQDGGVLMASFPTKVPLGKAYAVTIKAQPTGPTDYCVVKGGAGVVLTGDVSDVDVSCVPIEDAVYYGACLTALASGNVEKVLHYYGEASYLPSGAGGGTLTLRLTSLRVGDMGAPPATVSKTATVGSTSKLENVAVDANGKFAGVLGTVTVPGAANPITGRDIVIDNTKLTGKYAGQQFCAQLSGDVVQPISVTLMGSENTCVFFKTVDGAPLPTLTAATFAGGCPL